MKRLWVSLLLSVLIASIALGWLIDAVFERLAEPAPDPALQALQALGRSLADGIDRDGGDGLAFSGPALQLLPLADFALPDSLQSDFQRGEPLLLESDHGLRLHYLLPRSGQVLSLAVPAPAPSLIGDDLRLGLTLLFHGGMAGFVVLWLWPLLWRLRLLRQTAQAFGEGELQRRIAPQPGSYIADIEREFNCMAQRIEALVADNKLLGSAVSHDLRTPLARLRFGIDALGETADPGMQHRYRERISADIASMESLVELLLTYARLEQARFDFHEETVALGPLLAEVVEQADAHGKQVVLASVEGDDRVVGDRRYLRMLIGNLLQNAVGHAHGRVLLQVGANDAGVQLSVEDDGPGIAPQRRAEVLKPFVRGDASRGHGLGLAIVARIADGHRAQVSIDRSSELGGARFLLQFPRVSP